MNSDREMLDLAALAAGYKLVWSCGGIPVNTPTLFTGLCSDQVWNPLVDDGDALRLAVKLNIPIFPYDDETSTGTVGVVAKNFGSKEENTRRAIVRAAAEIGKGMV